MAAVAAVAVARRNRVPTPRGALWPRSLRDVHSWDDDVATSIEVTNRSVATNEREDVGVEAVLVNSAPCGADGVKISSAVVSADPAAF